MFWGTGQPEIYDVAVEVNNPEFVGKKIMGLEVYMPITSDYITNMKGWCSTKLSVKNQANNPNICVKEGVLSGNYLTVEFDEPVTITEEPLYVGYSFKVGKVMDASGNYVEEAKYPIPIVKTHTKGALWVHSSKSLPRWTDVNAQQGTGSALLVKIEGDFPTNAAEIIPSDIYYTECKKERNTKFTIANRGSSTIESVKYAFEVNGVTSTGSFKFDTPIPAIYGCKGTVDLVVPALDEMTTYNAKLIISKINEEDVNITADTKVKVLSFIPVTRPLVEEYTGLWCGYCPSGYVALEAMKRDYPDTFVALAFHDDDPMQVNRSFPVDVSGLPHSTINRNNAVEPGYIPAEWGSYASEIAIADISASIEWADKEHSKLKCTSVSRFAADNPAANYRVAYAIVADGLSNPAWKQKNYYSNPNNTPTFDDPLWDIFNNTTKEVSGLTFNDVVCYFKDYTGIEGSLPSDIKAGQEYEHLYEVPISQIGTGSESNPFTNYNLMRVVAIIFNGSTPVNCVSSAHLDYEVSVKDIENNGIDAYVTDTIYYDLYGRRVSNPGHGIYIKTEILNNGTTRMMKVAK